MMFVELLS